MANWVQIQPLNYAADSNDLSTQTFHGLNILVNGVQVGRINRYQPPTHTRKITGIRELNSNSYGRVIEQVPGTTEDENYKIECDRAEVWSDEMEIAFGFAATFTDLMDQTAAFVVEEQLLKGTTLYSQWNYLGCWFSSLGIEEFNVEGDSIIRRKATITYTSKQKGAGT